MDPTDALADTLDLTNPFTRAQLYEGLQRWPSLSVATRRTHVFRSLAAARRSLAIARDPDWAELALDVKTLEPLLRTPSAAESESYDQVCFRGNPWGELNAIPFALIILAFYKTWVVPAFGALLPLLTWILPYIFLKSVSGIPMSFSEYSNLMWQMWNGQFGSQAPQQPQNAALQIKQMLQNGWTLFTVGQAIWQPIQQARHFSRLDSSCHALGEVILNVKRMALRCTAAWGVWMPRWIQRWTEICPDDPRQAFAFVVETPHWLPHLLRGLGRFEVLWILAGREDVCAAQFVGGDKPVLMLRDFGDPLIAREKRVLSSIRLGAGKRSDYPEGAGVANHAILTGPNRGGKSSLMRGILLNVRLAHAFGAAFAGKAQMSRFTWIADGLRLDDRPGKLSMFEREVCFAQAILTPRPGLGLCLYDELFHSTNPPDAARTSEVFCDALWKRNDCLSLVSTHVYALARGAPDSVKKVCVAAWGPGAGAAGAESAESAYSFSYTLQRGICEVSSVELLLQQHGLTGKQPQPRPRQATKLLPSDQK